MTMNSKWSNGGGSSSSSDNNNDRSNRFRLKDDSGTFYRDIAFVPSGTLTMKEAATSSAKAASKEDAVDVREFYKSVLAMPRTVAIAKKKKQRTQQSSVKSGNDSTPPLSTEPTSTSQVSPVVAATSQAVATESSSISPSLPKQTTVFTAEEIVRRNWQSSSKGPSRVIADGYVLCEPCQIEVREDDLERHRRGTAHLISEESPVKPLDHLTLGHSNKGFRMLVNSGWDYEKGLGVDGQGVRHPIATRLKHDRLALGATGANKKLVTHTFEEIEKSRTKPTAKSNRRVPLSAEDYRRKAEKERRERVKLMNYMKK
ncbi:G patch domain and ankyrin repeat-containing protein 1 [Entomortierella chlamydospora]|uniref:G patch domain and ankyrin repeat-containing protein 1 n=1 Tax=Entomortierella chlamydospora TaxID=101097 RepID=A0A9P6T220_9FUNG|nr:G patch domain and ankyrin repeat-containing protein 1 [Entomortierella chlamydospora]KAG0019286.1 G patch domain and ankyrin repeat-containing protein 1 [Entomortierella chlamydospora]